MSDWLTISRTDHAKHGYQPPSDFNFSASLPMVPLLVSELSHALPHYVMGFVRHEEQTHLVALLGRRKESHFYLQPDGRWMADYIPAMIRAHPFRLVPSDQGDQVLQINDAHLVESGGEALFDKEGNLSETMTRLVEFLKQCEQNRQVTLLACNALWDDGVLVPWEEEGSGPWAKGLYRLDEPTLNKKSAEEFHALRGVAMAIAYAQMFSRNQVGQLARRAKFLEEHAAKSTENGADIDAILSDESGNIKFN